MRLLSALQNQLLLILLTRRNASHHLSKKHINEHVHYHLLSVLALH